MKIEVAPWMEGYNVQMEELYTKLSLETIDNRPLGQESQKVENYKTLFDRNESKLHQASKHTPAKKILGKGDPGMGKTTLSKKISHDWACRAFTNFVIVFFVFVKLVQPSNPIENVIIDQNPWLEGFGIGKQKLKYILETYGRSCLLIIDGLDEHTVEQNAEIFKLIQGRKYPQCNLFLTSRPHYLSDENEHFPTIIRVDGFTRSEAEKFASKLLDDPNKISDVFDFDESLHRCPILLSFLCLLVREEDIEKLGKSISTGEIYFRMIRCLYKKFTLRQNLEYNESEFIQVIKKIGKLALQTLLSGSSLLKRQHVLEKVGSEAFDYGLLIGHNDFSKLFGDITADIYVTFPHASIQEFLGAFFFITELDGGQSVINLLRGNQDYIKENDSFLSFCVWLMYSNKSYLNIENKFEVRQKLADHMAGLNYPMHYHCLTLGWAHEKNDQLGFYFGSDVFVHYQANRILRFGLTPFSRYEEPGEIIAKLLSNTKSRLKSFNTIFVNECQATLAGASDIILQIREPKELLSQGYGYDYSLERVNAVLNHSEYLTTNARLHVFKDPGFNVELKLQLSSESLLELHFYCSVIVDNFPLSPTLSRVTLFSQCRQQGTIAALCRAVKDGLLPNLSHLSLIECQMTSSDTLLEPRWPKLTHLHLFGCNFEQQNFSKMFKTCNTSSDAFPRLTSLGLSFGESLSQPLLLSKFVKFSWNMLTELFVILANGDQYSEFGVLLQIMPKLVSLGITLEETDQKLNMKQLQLEKLCNLANLSLHKCLASNDHVSVLCESLRRHKICKLDLSRTTALSGTVELLLVNPFPRLEHLNLRHCRLRITDLTSLARACNEGKIPQIKHLDISDNWIPDQCSGLNAFFENKCTWNQLLSLNFRGTLTVNDELNDFVASGCLSSLHELSAIKLNNWAITTNWQNLQKLCVHGCDKDALKTVFDALKRGFLPALNILCVQHPFSYREFLQIDTVRYLLESNINVHEARPGTIEYPFQTATCVCQYEIYSKVESSPSEQEHFPPEAGQFDVEQAQPSAASRTIKRCCCCQS